MEFKNILVAYDSSGFSNRAFKSALDIAEPNKTKITIITVLTGAYQPSIGFRVKHTERTLENQQKLIKQIFSNLESAANKRKVSIALKILHNSSVSKGILNYINSHRFDLIVMGSHGRIGLNRLILGSVANEIAHKSKIPVMVVK